MAEDVLWTKQLPHGMQIWQQLLASLSILSIRAIIWTVSLVRRNTTCKDKFCRLRGTLKPILLKRQ